MSTGESDYAKRVVELSMQLANSRADVENLRMRIKAVDKEHEQLKKDRADMVDRFDAALRRAKAEGWREGMREAQQEARFGVMELRAAYEKRGTLVLKYSTDALQDFADILESHIAKIDARAAQIEEGE